MAVSSLSDLPPTPLRAGLALRLAWQRRGLAGWRLALAAFTLGLFALSLILDLEAALHQGLAREGRRLLGGDLEVLTGSSPPPPALRALAERAGARVSEVVTFRSLIRAPSGETALVEVKAVDDAYPLVGRLAARPAAALSLLLGADAGHGLVAEPDLGERLGVGLGETLGLGSSRLRLSGWLDAAPDEFGRPLFGPRLLIPLAVLPETGLLAPGALAEYALRIAFPHPDAKAARALARAITAAFPEEGLRLRRPEDAEGRLGDLAARLGLALRLAALSALLLGGLGISQGLGVALRLRAPLFALLRSLGAPAGLLLGVALAELAGVLLPALLGGLILGALAARGVGRLLSPFLPLAPGPAPSALAETAAFGLLLALALTLPRLARTLEAPPALLLREESLPEERPAQPSLPLSFRRRLDAGGGIAGAGLLALLFLSSAPDLALPLWFLAALGGGALVMRLIERLGIPLLRPGRGPLFWRLALRRLHDRARRPLFAASPFVTFGLGLVAFTVVAETGASLEAEISETLPRAAPRFFVIDIQPDQRAPFTALIESLAPGTRLDLVPSLRARIVRLGEETPEALLARHPREAWVLRGERGLTYAAVPPPADRVVAGAWWPPDYEGPPLLSFDAEIARAFGLKTGDRVTLNVLGRTLTFTIANLRTVNWGRLGINFVMIADPASLQGAPHGFIAALYPGPGFPPDGRLMRAIAQAFPNLTVIPMALILGTFRHWVEALDAALRATIAVSLAAGALVLAAAWAAELGPRRFETALLRALGAARSPLFAAWLAECLLSGAAAGGAGVGVGLAASFALSRFVFHLPFHPAAAPLLLAFAGALGLSLLAGTILLAALLRLRPALLFRPA
jgi:putative ABC transport system permease protein